jgi:hypothetical protein
VQLDLSVMTLDPACWERPEMAAWADLSPKGGENSRKLLSAAEARRFYQCMSATKVVRFLAEPKLVCLSGRPATFLSGGQQAVPEVAATGGGIGTRFEPFGTQLTFLPVVIDRDTVHLQVEASLSALTQATGFSVGGTVVAGRDEQRVQTKVAMSCGQTMFMNLGRGSDGRDLLVMVTPRPFEPTPSAVALPAPPMPAPCPTVMPTVWSAPMPIAVVPASYQETAVEPKLAKLMAKYRQACACGDSAKSRKFAEKCMVIDPTCFGK